MSNPILEGMVYTVGYDTYEATWKGLSRFTRFQMTLRGWAPGGRKGAPALRTTTERNA